MPTALIMERLFAYFDVEKSEKDMLLSAVQQWALTEGYSSILIELGKLDLVEPAPDPIADIPHVNPVTKKDMGQLPVSFCSPSSHEVSLIYRSFLSLIYQWQKTKKSSESEDANAATPFNLTNLRSNMADLISARRHLVSDPLSRQKLIEESAVEDAKDRLQHEFSRLEQQGLANLPITRKKSIQKWMWEWHNELTPRLEAEIEAVLASEEKARGACFVSFPQLPLIPYMLTN